MVHVFNDDYDEPHKFVFASIADGFIDLLIPKANRVVGIFVSSPFVCTTI